MSPGAEATPPHPAVPVGATSPANPVVLPDPFAAEAVGGSNPQAGQAPPPTPGQATPGPAFIVTPAEDEFGAEEVAYGAAGFAAGAVAGGVAGVVAGKAVVASQQNEKKG
jgi:hypothetical protein